MHKRARLRAVLFIQSFPKKRAALRAAQEATAYLGDQGTLKPTFPKLAVTTYWVMLLVGVRPVYTSLATGVGGFT